VGYSEASKCATILKAFQDSYRSPLSVILLDDIERLIDYSPIGPRFSNTVRTRRGRRRRKKDERAKKRKSRRRG